MIFFCIENINLLPPLRQISIVQSIRTPEHAFVQKNEYTYSFHFHFSIWLVNFFLQSKNIIRQFLQVVVWVADITLQKKIV